MQSVAFLKQVFMPVKEKAAQNNIKSVESAQLSAEIRSILKQIECVEKRFDWETDSDMIDSLIYEHHSLLSRYRHLLMLAKQMSLNISPSLS